MEDSFGLYVWPCAFVLAKFLTRHRAQLKDLRILELGCGCGLPGITASKFGAKVIFTDNAANASALALCRKNCEANGLNEPKILGLTWDIDCSTQACVQMMNEKIDWIIGSDLLYDPSVFEPLLATVKVLLELNKNAVFYFSYQLRSTEWSIAYLLRKYGLVCRRIPENEWYSFDACVVLPSSTADSLHGHQIQMARITLEDYDL